MKDPQTPSLAAAALPILAIGFATSVAMWFVGYATHLPDLAVAPVITGSLLLLCQIGGGFLAGRSAGRRKPVAIGLATGVVTGFINLLVLGALVTDQGDGSGEFARSAGVKVLGYLGFSAAAGAFGALLAVLLLQTRSKEARPQASSRVWLARFAIVAALAAIPVLLSGGLVTSTETGLAVPDWPTSFQANMFLFPISKMTGGIYYEHAHRLFGSLVGLTVLTFTICVALRERNRPMNLLAIVILGGASIGSFFVTGAVHNVLLPAAVIASLFIAFRFGSWRFGTALSALALVIIQGILGGIRVEATSTALAFVHGILGQLTFAILCVTAAFFTEKWYSAGAAKGEPDKFMRTIALIALVTVMLQLVLGAGARHFQQHPAFMHPHIAVGVIVLAVGPLAGFRAKSRHRERRPVRFFGTDLMHAILLQFALGWVTFFVVMSNKASDPPIEVILATAHQGIGALILAAAALLFAWTWKLVPRKNSAEAMSAPAG